MDFDILFIMVIAPINELRYYFLNPIGYESLIYGAEYLFLDYMDML